MSTFRFEISCLVRKTIIRVYEVEAETRDKAYEIARYGDVDNDERIIDVIDDEIESVETEWVRG